MPVFLRLENEDANSTTSQGSVRMDEAEGSAQAECITAHERGLLREGCSHDGAGTLEGSSQPGREAWKSIAGVGAKARKGGALQRGWGWGRSKEGSVRGVMRRNGKLPGTGSRDEAGQTNG